MSDTDEIRRLEEKIALLERRIIALEASGERRPEAVPTGAARGSQQPVLPRRPAPRRQPAARTGDAGFAFNAERALKWAGVILVFLAVAFAMSIAIERGWLTPEVRVAGGITVAVVLVAAGLAIHERRRLYAETLEGAGFAVSYVTFFAGYQVLDVLPYWLSFSAMVVTTVVAFWLSLRQRQPGLAAIGLLGGLATPLALGLGGADPAGDPGSIVALAVYVTLLSLAALVIYFREGWGSLLVATGVFSAIAMAITIAQVESTGDQIAAQIMVAAVGLAAWGAATVRALHPVTRDTATRVAFLDAALANVELRAAGIIPVVTILGSLPIWEPTTDQAGLVAVAGGVGVALIAWALWAESRPLATSHVGGAALLFVVGSGLLFEGPTLALALAVQAATLFLVGQQVDDPYMRTGGGFLGALAAVVFVSDASELIFEGRRIGWWHAIAHGLAIVIGFGIAAAARDEMSRAAAGLSSYLATMGWVVELAHHLSEAQAVISVGWALLAIVTMGVAVATRDKGVFKLGLGTMALVVAKLIFVDMAAVDTIWRVAVFFGTGTALLAIGYRMPALWAALTGGDEASRIDVTDRGSGLP